MSEFNQEISNFVKEPLLQHGQLVPAKEIEEPFDISKNKLDLWLSFARDLCDTQGFQCLAFTELSDPIRNKLGFSKNLSPRVIFYRTKMEERGQLVINPKVEVAKNGFSAPVIEFCGSIGHGKFCYFIKRPIYLTLKGIFYDGNKLQSSSFTPFNGYCDLSLHEIDHLDGKTAINDPTNFCDIRSAEDWESILDFFSEEGLEDFIKQVSPDGVLVYNKKKDIYEIVGVNGEYICQYFPKKK